MTLTGLGRSAKHLAYRQVARASRRLQRHRSLHADLLENDEAYLVVFDAPGAELSDVQVRYLDGAIHFRVDRFRSFHDGFEMRFPGRSMSLDGTADLPSNAVQPRAATAHLSDRGTVSIQVPKEAGGDGGDEQVAVDTEQSISAETTVGSDSSTSGEATVTAEDGSVSAERGGATTADESSETGDESRDAVGGSAQNGSETTAGEDESSAIAADDA